MQLRATRLTAISHAARRAVAPAAFTPLQLFAANEQGIWLDPSDPATMFQDAAGTVPVTAVEQPVGMILDKSRGLVLGSELVTNGTFDTDTDWNKGTGWVIGSGVASKTAGTAAFLDQAITAPVNSFCQITYTVSASAGSITPQFSGGITASATPRNVSGTYSEYLAVPSGTTSFRFLANSAFVGTIDNISVRELPGNHAFQATATSRPVLSARYNLLTKTEQFNDAVWAVVSSGGVVTKAAAQIAFPAISAPSGIAVVRQTFTSAAATYLGSVEMKASTAGDVGKKIGIWINDGSFTNVTWHTLTADWVAVSVTESLSATTSYWTVGVAGSDIPGGGNQGAVTVDIRKADLRVTNDAAGQPVYQRVNTATDYDTTGFKPYLRFDGTDDWLQTNSINFSATDKVTVVAGVRKLSDAVNYGVVSELGADAPSGSFTMLAPHVGATYSWLSKGTSGAYAVTGTTYASPTTNIIGGIGNISGDSSILRINGIQAAEKTDDQGPGNYGNYPLYIGRRGGTTLPFNGRLYGLIVRGAQSTAQQITDTENWLNQRTGAY